MHKMFYNYLINFLKKVIKELNYKDTNESNSITQTLNLMSLK